jgi:hypothetical protein
MYRCFYEDNVKMSREETKRNVDIVMPLVDDILTYVHERDKRFKIRPLRLCNNEWSKFNLIYNIFWKFPNNL